MVPSTRPVARPAPITRLTWAPSPHTLAVVTSLAQLGKLLNNIRERKWYVIGAGGNNGVGVHAIGGAGGHRKSPMWKLVAKRLKQRRSEYWKWVKRANDLVATLTESIDRWSELKQRNSRLPPCPVSLANLPETITSAQAKDPMYVPADVGATRSERVDVGFVDKYRTLRTHLEEVKVAGPAHAHGLVKYLAATYVDTSNRVINGLGPLLSSSAGQDGVHVVPGNSVDTALAYTPRLKAIARPLPMSMLPPQVAIDSGNWFTVENMCVLAGWRAVLTERMRHDYAHIVSVLHEVTLVLPPTAGQTPAEYGVHRLQAGQPAPPAAVGNAVMPQPVAAEAGHDDADGSSSGTITRARA